MSKIQVLATAGRPAGTQESLPFDATFYPMGYRVSIATNSDDLLGAAEGAWACYVPWRREAHIRVEIQVNHSSTRLVRASRFRSDGHLVTVEADPDNYVVCDLRAGYAFGRLSAKTASDHALVRYHFLEPAVYVLLDAMFLLPVHASCVALDGRAVMLCGDSGAGKTTLSYACARRSWSYLADDATHVVRDDTPEVTVIGRPYGIRFRQTARTVFPELGQFSPRLRPNGKVDYEVASEDLGLQPLQVAQATHVAFLTRHPGLRSPSCSPFSLIAARRYLEKVINFGDEELHAAQSACIGKLLRLPVFQLDYDDLGETEALLRRIVDR